MAAARSQTLAEAYAEPTNFLEIDVSDAQTHGFGKVRRGFPVRGGPLRSPD
jgi:hypothetical protein